MMGPFLTRIEINPRRRASTRVLASPHRMHGAVNLCFPPSASPGRILWRVDHTAAATYLYLVSDLAPDATGFVEEHGWPAAGGWATRDYSPLLERLRDGMPFSFRLAANPVRHVRPEAKTGVDIGELDSRSADNGAEERRARGRRIAHATVAHQLGWLVAGAHKWGFTVGSADEPTARIVERRKLVFRRGKLEITVGMAVFEGNLIVTDAAELRRRLVSGIGPAKAYGCGMLTLAPPSP